MLLRVFTSVEKWAVSWSLALEFSCLLYFKNILWAFLLEAHIKVGLLFLQSQQYRMWEVQIQFFECSKEASYPTVQKPFDSIGCKVCAEERLHLLETKPCTCLARRKASVSGLVHPSLSSGLLRLFHKTLVVDHTGNSWKAGGGQYWPYQELLLPYQGGRWPQE